MGSGAAQRVRVAFAVAAVASVVGLVALVALGDRATARYASLPCQLAQVRSPVGSIEIVALGTSRTWRGVDPIALAEGAGLDPAAANVVNAGRPGRDLGHIHRQLRDLDDGRGIAGPILVEFTPEDGTNWGGRPPYYQYRDDYAALVPLRDLLGDWSAKPREPAYGRLRDLLAQLQLRVDAGLERLLTAPPASTGVALAAAAPGPSGCLPRERAAPVAEHARAAAREMRRRERRLERRVGPDGTWRDLPAATWEQPVNLDRQAAYLDRIAALGRARDVPVLAVWIPRYLDPAPSVDAVAAFERRHGIELLVPGPELLDVLYGSDRRYYGDPNHLSREGAALFSRWLGEQVAARSGA